MSNPAVVVVVSADVALRTHVRLTLDGDRFEVLETEDAAGCRALVEQRFPDLVLIELVSEHDPQAALLAELRPAPESPGVPTLALVPRGSSGSNAPREQRLGVPCTSFDLLSTVERLVAT